jgi:DNA-directed RNA polymerase III subunit RPC3
LNFGSSVFNAWFLFETLGSSSGGMEALQENMHKLVMARYVERCPISEPFLALPSEEEAAPVRRRGAKSAKVIAFFLV